MTSALTAPPPPSVPAPVEIEREAYDRGYREGEQAGREIVERQVEARVQRLTETLAGLGTLRQQMMQETEREMVQLSLAIAKRIIRRDASANRELAVALARVALDRLGERSGVTIRLNPVDHALATTQGPDWGEATVVADESVEPGGCRVESARGMLDASVDAQLGEIEHVLTSEDTTTILPSVNDK